MNAAQRATVVAASAVILFCAGYCLPMLIDLPLPRYFPLEHRWGLAPDLGAISQGWYGRVLFAFLFSVAPAALLDLLLARMTGPVTARLPLLVGLAAAAVVLLTLGFLMVREFGRGGIL